MDCNPNDPVPLPVADRIFGTYRCPKDHGLEAYGVVSGEPPSPSWGSWRILCDPTNLRMKGHVIHRSDPTIYIA